MKSWTLRRNAPGNIELPQVWVWGGPEAYDWALDMPTPALVLLRTPPPLFLIRLPPYCFRRTVHETVYWPRVCLLLLEIWISSSHQSCENPCAWVLLSPGDDYSDCPNFPRFSLMSLHRGLIRTVHHRGRESKCKST
jgi:hypothetical protein